MPIGCKAETTVNFPRSDYYIENNVFYTEPVFGCAEIVNRKYYYLDY
jgi:hypothetical protein